MKVLNKDIIFWRLAYLNMAAKQSSKIKFRLTVSSNMLEQNWVIYFN